MEIKGETSNGQLTKDKLMPGVKKIIVVRIPYLSEGEDPGEAQDIFSATKRIGLEARAVALEAVVETLINQMDTLQNRFNVQKFELEKYIREITHLNQVVQNQKAKLDRKEKVEQIWALTAERIVYLRGLLEKVTGKETKRDLIDRLNKVFAYLSNM